MKICRNRSVAGTWAAHGPLHVRAGDNDLAKRDVRVWKRDPNFGAFGRRSLWDSITCDAAEMWVQFHTEMSKPWFEEHRSLPCMIIAWDLCPGTASEKAWQACHWHSWGKREKWVVTCTLFCSYIVVHL